MSDRFPFFKKAGTAVLNGITWPIRHWRISAIVVIALVIAYVVMDQMLLRKLAAQREAIRASGRALAFADLVPKDLDDAQNAAVDYRYAAAQLSRAGGTSDNWYDLYGRFLDQHAPPEQSPSADEEKSKPLTPDETAKLASHLEQFQPALDILKQAQSRRGCSFRDYDSPDAIAAVASEPGAFLPALTQVRDLVRLVSFRAVWEGTQGRPDAALEWLTVGLHIGNHSDAEPVMLTGMVRAACMGILYDSMQIILYEGDLPATLPPGFEEALALFADRKRFGRILEGERCFSAAMQSHQERNSSRFARPYLTSQRIKINELLIALNEMITEPDLARRKELRTMIEARGESHSTPNLQVALLAPAMLRGTEAFDRQVAQAEICQLAIALKQYKRDHGAYPESLDALLPTYIETLPQDPFSGESYGYRTEGEGFELESAPYPKGKKGTGQYTWRSIR